MADKMTFPKSWEQFLHDYEFEDSRKIYTNGARLIPSFRVKQMMEHYLVEAKSEAVREFAERLTDKADLIKVNPFDSKWAISQDNIDNLVKEMTEVNEK